MFAKAIEQAALASTELSGRELLSVYESYWDSVSREKTLISGKYAEGEKTATHRIAKSMLECGVEVAIVMKSTGLSQEEVEKIKASL